MNIITAENLTKTYGEKILFANISIGLDENDKIGIVGVNGTGKTSLIKIIAGLEQPDQGNVIKGNSVRIEYLPQEPELISENTVLTEVFKGNTPIMTVLREYERILVQSEAQPQTELEKGRLQELSEQIESLDGWQVESNAKTVLTQLGITDFSASVGSLSGGQSRRVALASALITPCDLLILDEPTNHIDTDTIAWLEQYLGRRKGALLMVTHDRYFLDRVANRIVEVEGGRLYSYQGNYTKFLELKAEREEREEGSERKRQNLLRKELAWVRRGAKARSTKQKARLDRYEELSSLETYRPRGNLEIAVGSSRLGKTVIELDHISHSYDKNEIIRDFSYIILRNDRIGLVGSNGCGKSTLLNLIAGQLEADKGSFARGQTVKIGYFSQETSHMDERLRAIDYIREEANYIQTGDNTTVSASQLMEQFLFPPALQWTPIGKLSGGEKRRLYLLRVLMSAPNVLLLDEPTNDLDIPTLTVLEDYLDSFPGAVLAASHDRYFLDRICQKVFVFEGKGVIKQYPGGYSDYHELIQVDPKSAKETPPQKEAKKAEPKPEKARKLTFKEQREYETIESDIQRVEHELKAVTAQINLYGSDFESLQRLVSEQQQLEKQLDDLFERWTYLEAIAAEPEK